MVKTTNTVIRIHVIIITVSIVVQLSIYILACSIGTSIKCVISKTINALQWTRKFIKCVQIQYLRPARQQAVLQ